MMKMTEIELIKEKGIKYHFPFRMTIKNVDKPEKQQELHQHSIYDSN